MPSSQNQSKTLRKLVKALNPSTPLKKLLIFVLIFGIVGGGYFLYSSLAATGPDDKPSCWIKNSDRSLYCWGRNNYGQLGTGNTINSSIVAKAQIGSVRSVSVGYDHTCAIKTDSTLWCWGNNDYGQLGLGFRYGFSSIPKRVTYLPAVAKVSAGNEYTCASKTDGSLYCWGNNEDGLLGTGEYYSKPTPTYMNFTGTANIAAGDGSTCVTKTDGSLWCWGHNENGQLGIGDHTNKMHPTRLFFSSTAQISLGQNHTCASRTDGSLYCWGSNNRGQLGIGSFTDKSAPTRVFFSSTAKISLGAFHTCASRTDGSLYCWGDNTNGQLGNGYSALQSAPQRVFFSQAAEVKAGLYHTCASSTYGTGTVFCWGLNNYGQLGVGDYTNWYYPQDLNFRWQ